MSVVKQNRQRKLPLPEVTFLDSTLELFEAQVDMAMFDPSVPSLTPLSEFQKATQQVVSEHSQECS
jgi:hypothetical protein